jgi:DNA-binding response OmpR family regulator
VSILYTFGAERSILERLGAVFLPFELRCEEPVPSDFPRHSIALVAYPGRFQSMPPLPTHVPFIAYGAADYLVDAYGDGAADYLKDPWSASECLLRLERVLGLVEIKVPVHGLTLRGESLSGPRGTIDLPGEEAELLRILSREYPRRVSRNILNRLIWPAMTDESRAVDITISRLRKHITLVSEPLHCTQIRSIRGFGYSLR